MVHAIIFASLLAATALAQSQDGGYGSECQPSVVTATKCSSGFTCILTENIPGGKGFCHQLSNEGESCGGGSIAYPAVCNAGLSCVEPEPVAGTIQSGTCQAVTTTSSAASSQVTMGPATGGYGDECQPSVPSATRCDADFTCILTTPNLPGGKGFCHAVSKVGGSCGGGSIQYPPICADGLTCVLPTGTSGTIEQGTCQAGSDDGSKTTTSAAAPVTATSKSAGTQAATSAASTKPVTTTNIKNGAGAVAVTAGFAFVASLFAL
ncbi:hypothetical protein HDU81_008114 [Chytriomyces hyalinus]|nr:hypothetical protein HDU81_008114 [Chytriomyces hyalinus]